MAGRAIRISSRIAFLLCGLISLLTAVPYAGMQGEDLPVQSEWIVFVVVLALAGVFNVTLTFLPRSWIARICRKDRDDERLFSLPLKLLGIFAAIFYVLALFAYFAPHSWNLNPQLMLLLCPMYVVRMTIDPPPVAIFLLLAPMNAAVYGAIGASLGYVVLTFPRKVVGGSP